MIQPSGGNTMLWPSLLAVMAVMAVIMVAFRDIATRWLSKTDTTNSIMVCTTGCVMFSGLSTIVLGWRQGFALFALTGILQGVGHYFLVSAFIYGKAVVVAPFRDFAMLWASVYGYLMFGDIPGIMTITGAFIVIASGLFIFYRETRRGS